MEICSCVLLACSILYKPLTNNKVSPEKSLSEPIPTSEELGRSMAEFNRLYSQYKRAGYELSARLHQAQRNSIDSLK